MRSLARLLFPRSIALVGGRECEVAIRKTQALGFAGRIWPINPRRSELAGLATFASVADLPEAPDAAFVAVRREPTIEVVHALSRLGAGGAVVFASGFAETGDVDLQRDLVEAAAGMPFLGPNCNGYVNVLAKAALWPDDHGCGPCGRGVAIVAQSGNIAVNFTMMRRALPVAGVFALGNQADVDMAQMIEGLAEDERITAIGLHIEGLGDVPAFVRAVERARARRKPIVALKTGRSAAGARITLSHTASLSGEDALYDALFRRLGVVRVASITAFAETLKLLHCGGPTSGPRLVSMSCSGGEAALVADLAEGRGVMFPAFDAAGEAAVAATLGGRAVSNPLDYQTFIWGHADKLAATFAAALSGGFDAGLLILDIPTVPGVDGSSWVATAEAFRRAVETTGTRAAVVATLPECWPEEVASRLAEAGIAPLAGLDDALDAFENAGAIGQAWAEPADEFRLLAGPPAASAAASMTEHAAKTLLAAAGLTVPPGQVCAPAEASRIASELGFPVVVKASDADIVHKTEAGGVALDLRSEAAVAAVAERMGSGRLLVERMVEGAVCELMVGVKADPQFGLALVIGAGGVLAELLADTVTLLLPTTRAKVDAALSRLRVAALVDGYRGRAGDRVAALDAILALADFAESLAGRLVELEVNPLLVLPPGRGAVVADALLRLAPLPRDVRDPSPLLPQAGEGVFERCTMSDPVRTQRRGAVLEVTIDRPKANAIDAATSRLMGEVFAAFRDDAELRCAILTGAGEKFFCPGWDLKAAAAGEAPDADYGVGGFGGLQELPGLNKPVIAAINGIAFGGGFEIALAADIILAADHASFALPEIKSGTLADAATIKLPRTIPHHVAMELLLTGRRMDASEARRWGIVSEILPAAGLMDRARALADQLAAGPPLVFAAIKEVVRETAHLPIQQAFDRVTNRLLPTVDALYGSEDQKEGARAFAEKRAPVWRGT